MTIDKCRKYLLRFILIVLLLAVIATIAQFRIYRTEVTNIDDRIVEFAAGTEYYGFVGDGYEVGDVVTVFMWKYFVLGAW